MSFAQKRILVCIITTVVIGCIAVGVIFFKTRFTKSQGIDEMSPPASSLTPEFTLEPGWVTNQNPAGWMTCFYERGLENQLTLQDVCLPATHDSAAYAVIGGVQQLTAPWTITQDLDVGEQLRAGARKFDLRVVRSIKKNADEPKYFIHHGGIKTALLDDVLNDISNYASSPDAEKETIFLQFTHFRGFNADTKQTLFEHLSKKFQRHLFIKQTGEEMMKLPLKRYQNKIVILVGSHIATPTPGIYQLNTKNSIYLYNRYSNKDEAQRMIEDQVKKFKAFDADDTLFLLNWTLTPQVSIGIPKSVKSLANNANSQLSKIFKNLDIPLARPNPSGKSINFINVDFYGSSARDVLEACEIVMSNREWAE